ncbi:hypothetical protein C3920_00255, partial [Novacetimonas pomaceti]
MRIDRRDMSATGRAATQHPARLRTGPPVSWLAALFLIPCHPHIGYGRGGDMAAPPAWIPFRPGPLPRPCGDAGKWADRINVSCAGSCTGEG